MTRGVRRLSKKEKGETNLGWKARELTGQTRSTPSTAWRWHLNAYFLSCDFGEGSKYSTAMRPSTDDIAYPIKVKQVNKADR